MNFSILFKVNLSNIFDNAGRVVIGLKLSASSVDPDLWAGMILPIFNIEGKTIFLSEILYNSAK